MVLLEVEATKRNVMSRRNKGKDRERRKSQGGTQKTPPPPAPPPAPAPTPPPPPAPPVGRLVFVPPAKPQACEDELTVLASTMHPYHLRFAMAFAAGKSGGEAAVAAGFKGVQPRVSACRLLRREDIRRYIVLARQRASVASQVNLSALLEHLWIQAKDPTASQSSRDKAVAHLVKILGPQAVAAPPASETSPQGSLVDTADEVDKVLADYEARKAEQGPGEEES